ncbi:hypothetical protein ABG79_01564 [Caloramator mitchellensis]|uniref:Division initiation protein n=1 Tax=Caloramator mitchellensis TaxID=908809 RepID=A0A0R3K0Y1_CALMK|nr:DUF881 domain-containing protein [Caloramator mitchellensis]KRQ86581.1 hypothetical protein ABG79_01564 [Caloramator mitchellensis]
MKLDSKKFFLLFLGIICGVILTSFIISNPFTPSMILTYDQFQKKSIEVEQLKAQINTMIRDIDIYNKKLEEYNKNTKINDNVISTLKKELDYVKLFSGYDDVKGNGIRILIDDNHDYESSDDNILDYITHNSDILYVVFDLKNAGAEAISVNGKRIVSISEITCEGPIIKINGEYIVPPFEILAIGDPDALYYAMTMPESKIKELQFRQLYVKMTKEVNLYINGYKKNFAPRFAKISK